jgi:hypothetical protein
MPMLADNLIGCPAILSLVMLRDNRIVREWFSDKITIYTHSSPPDAQPFFFDLPYEINCLKQSSMPTKA